jgi:NosR/NirI family nitrous oxide reductase transcriptional regulator
MLFDLLLLVVLLVVSGIALYKKRSRGLIVLLSLLTVLYYGFIRKGCLCPVGTIQNITDALASGTIPAGFIVLLGVIPLLTALFAGRIFCGTSCPLGAVQDLLALDCIKVPKFVDRVLILIPPVILYIVIIGLMRGNGYLLCKYDPFVSLFRGNGSMLFLTIPFLVLAVIISRPFCRYLCPYGSLLGIFSLLSRFKVEIEPDNNCRDCTLCEPACPVDVIRSGPRENMSDFKSAGSILLSLILVISLVLAGKGIAISDQWFFEKDPLKLSLELQQNLTIAGMVLGGIIGLSWILELVAATQKLRSNYSPITHRCISCGRCYNHCPGEFKRVKKEIK